MKKILLIIFALGGFTLSTFAQNNSHNKFSVGIDVGLPVGEYSQYYNLFIGGSIKYDIAIDRGTAFTLSAGYTSLTSKPITISIGSFKYPAEKFIPLKAGIKYLFAGAFYGEAQLGAVFNTQTDGGTAFLYSPGFGYNFGNTVDIGVRYEVWSKNGTTGQVAARLGFSF